jgi:Ca2+-binding EF-hand superfamily protein
MSYFRTFFGTLEELVYPNHPNPMAKQFTKFNQLILIAYREFGAVTNEMVFELRRANQPKVIHGIGDFAKKTAIRNVMEKVDFTKPQVTVLYDRYHSLQFYEEDKEKDNRMNFAQFKKFLSMSLTFGDYENYDGADKERVKGIGHRFITSLFELWSKGQNKITFAELVIGLDGLYNGDILAKSDLIFTLHDEDRDGKLDTSDVIRVSESFLFLFSAMEGETHLNAVSSFLRTAMSTETVEYEKNSFRAVIMSEPFLVEYLDKTIQSCFNFEVGKMLSIIQSNTSQPTKKYGWIGSLPKLSFNPRKDGNGSIGSTSVAASSFKEQTEEVVILDPDFNI